MAEGTARDSRLWRIIILLPRCVERISGQQENETTELLLLRSCFGWCFFSRSSFFGWCFFSRSSFFGWCFFHCSFFSWCFLCGFLCGHMCIVLLVYVVGFSFWQLDTRGNLLSLAKPVAITLNEVNRSKVLRKNFATIAVSPASFFLTKKCLGL